MLHRYLQMNCAIIEALRSNELTNAKDLYTLDPLDDSDIRLATTVKDFLQPVKQITTALTPSTRMTSMGTSQIYLNQFSL
jgi:hypothetical protein